MGGRDRISGSPKIVDVIAEGTSLRLTQRSDYASYLALTTTTCRRCWTRCSGKLTTSG